MLASIIHTCDPFIVRFTESFGIRWYGVSYAIGMLAGWAIMRWLSKTGRSPLTRAQIDSFTTAIILGLLIGGRLGHIAFLYEPELFSHFSSTFPFWGVLEIHRGGMSSHGGMIGVTIAIIWFARTSGLSIPHPFLHLADLACFVTPIGLGLGRLANWINHELVGKPLPDDLQSASPWWSVKYPSELLEPSFWRHITPDQQQHLIDVASTVATSSNAKDSVPALLHDACYAKNQVILDAVAPLLTARYPANFIQAFTDGVVLFGILIIIWLRPRKPGTLMGAFFIVYGALRLVSEQFRVPDADVFTMGWITLPMTLSAAMVFGGIVVLAYVHKSDDGPIGGLVPRARQST